MKKIKLFESFEVFEPINHGEPLNNREINFLQGYNVMCPEFILKDDNYYYVHDHRCENIKDLPLTYIHGLCSKFNITNYTINGDHTIDVLGSVRISTRKLSKIPLKFNIVSIDFDCDTNKLTTLEGAPKKVGRNFCCALNQLTTLKGSPEKVGGYFSCTFNKLTTLEGGPKKVGGNFYCTNNRLVSVEYKGIIKGGLYHDYETS